MNKAEDRAALIGQTKESLKAAEQPVDFRPGRSAPLFCVVDNGDLQIAGEKRTETVLAEDVSALLAWLKEWYG